MTWDPSCVYLFCSRDAGFLLLTCFSWWCSLSIVPAEKTRFRVSSEPISPLVKLKVPRTGLLHCCHFLPVLFPNWFSNRNSGAIGGFVRLNMTLSNHLPEALLRCSANTCGCPTHMASVLIVNLFFSRVAIEGSGWLISSRYLH